MLLLQAVSESEMRNCLSLVPVRGSEGLYMVTGPPSFTESAAFRRYRCYHSAWASAQEEQFPDSGVEGRLNAGGLFRAVRGSEDGRF